MATSKLTNNTTLVELDDTIKDKLKDAFHVTNIEITRQIDFFNKNLKPAIKGHYLSHLVSSIEEMINNNEKEKFLQKLKNHQGDNTDFLQSLVKQGILRLFTISLIGINHNARKAKLHTYRGGIAIYYSNFLNNNERRFAIAHELGHIVNNYLFEYNGDNSENIASLFAYIALLDKNNFYQKECQTYISNTDIELFNAYKNLIHS